MAPTQATLDSLLDRVEARHAGRRLWESGHGLELDLGELKGPIPWLKGVGRSSPPLKRMTVWPRARRVETPDWPTPGEQGTYENGDIAIGVVGRTLRVASSGHRTTFDGLAKHRRWDPADVLYFLGYALSHYLSLPYRLRDDQVTDVTESAQSTVVTVRYPVGAETHGSLERFHFAADGLLRRHDYHADILGPGANGAHYSREYVELDGIPIATRREVRLSVAGRATPLVVLAGRIQPVRWVEPRNRA